MVEQLEQLIGQRAILTFADGEVVVVRLLAVDAIDHEDVTFDVVEVRRSVGTSYPEDRAFIAPLSSIVAVTADIE